MNKTFKEKIVLFLDDNLTRTCIALLVGFIVWGIIGIFFDNLLIRVLSFYLGYFPILISLNKYVEKNKKNEK